MLKVGSARILLKKIFPNMEIALLFVVSLFSPFPLWLVQQFLPFPHFIEEIFKFFLVRFTPKTNNWRYPLILGLAFSFSESILYLINFFQLGDFSLFLPRLFLTSLLHTSTFFLLYYSKNKTYLSIISLLIAITIHYFYNQIIASIF
jgi:hypothetical protein